MPSDAKEPEPPLEKAPPLRSAIRRARVEAADHSEVLADLRAAEIARLEILADRLEPVLAEVPPDVDLFDVCVAQGSRPRLFIDMIGFVEMARDRRLYRFLQDTRHGRITLAESERLEPIVAAITDYVARRLVEREKALASDAASAFAADPPLGQVIAKEVIAKEAQQSPPPQHGSHRNFVQTVVFCVDLLGALLLVILLLAGALYLVTAFFTSPAMP